jgi:hypothetical protein
MRKKENSVSFYSSTRDISDSNSHDEPVKKHQQQLPGVDGKKNL